jgi:putative phage-type endonuclease
MPDKKNYYYMEQGTEEWFEHKLGKASASHVNDIMATVKSGEAATRRNYRARLVAEILTGEREETFQSVDMANGVEREAQARMAYEFKTDNTVEQVGFVDHPIIEGSGASPDGLIGEEGLVEIKCPKTSTHLDYMMTKKIPRNYMLQMQFQMACTGAEWCDFVSYDPKLPTNLQLLIIRVQRDHELILEIEDSVRTFLEGVKDTIAVLEKL